MRNFMYYRSEKHNSLICAFEKMIILDGDRIDYIIRDTSISGIVLLENVAKISTLGIENYLHTANR